MLSGWAYCYKDVQDGRRQIVGFLLPGDMGDPHAFILRRADHSVAMLGESTVASVDRSTILADIETYPRLARALWWMSLVDEGIARAWIANIGQRDAAHRMAHLLCELWLRAGMADQGDAHLIIPLTQGEIGEALGMTSVHTNRTIRFLREGGFVDFRGNKMVAADFDRLARFSQFDPTYLQFTRREVDER